MTKTASQHSLKRMQMSRKKAAAAGRAAIAAKKAATKVMK